MKSYAALAMLVAVAACGTSPESEPTAADTEALRGPGLVLDPHRPVRGKTVTAWTKAWWRWTFAVPAAQNPEVVLDADCAVGQHDDVFFVPSYDGSLTFERTCRVPRHTPVLVPLWALINDYPCPDPTFEPAPGQSLEDFLTQGVVDLNNTVQNLTVTVDGQPVSIESRRHTTGLFEFTADPSLVGVLPDACLQGTRQPGVSDGWWLVLAPSSGAHEVHVTAATPFGPIDARYRLITR